jgi:hypothetical protein
MLGQARVNLAGWFCYPVGANPPTDNTTLTLAGTTGAVTTGTVQVYQNSDFRIHQIQFFDTQTTNAGQFSVRWGTQNLFFMPTRVLAPTIFGQGNLPHPLPEPVTFPRGSVIVFELTNETANARTVYITVEGVNVNLV